MGNGRDEMDGKVVGNQTQKGMKLSKDAVQTENTNRSLGGKGGGNPGSWDLFKGK